MISMFVSAFGRAFLVVPRVINLNDSDPIRDSFQLSLWFVLTFMGDVVGLLFVQWLLGMGVHWNYAFMAYTLLFLVTALLHHFFLDEMEVEQGREGTVCDYLGNSFRMVGNFYSKPENLLWLLNNLFMANIYFSVMVWFPYYFAKIGFANQSSIISIMYPITACFGTLLIGALIKKIGDSWIELFKSGFYILSIGIPIGFLFIK